MLSFHVTFHETYIEVPCLVDPSSHDILHPSTQSCQFDHYQLDKKKAIHGKCNPTSLQLLVQQPRMRQMQMR